MTKQLCWFFVLFSQRQWKPMYKKYHAKSSIATLFTIEKTGGKYQISFREDKKAHCAMFMQWDVLQQLNGTNAFTQQ